MKTQLTISKAIACNVKGRAWEHDLGDATLFVGPSASGKTARLNAITLGLLGHIPKLGKRPTDTFKLSSGNRMEVNLFMSDGGHIQRWWELQAGKVAHGTRYSKDGHADSVGGGVGLALPFQVPTVMLDPQEYFSLSDRDRSAMAFRQMPTTKWLLESVKTLVLGGLKGQCPPNASKEVIARFDALAHTRPDNWLEASVATMRSYKNEAAAAVRRLSAGTQTMLDQQSDLPVGLDVESIRQEITKLRAEREQFVRQEAALPTAPDVDELRNQLATLKARLNQAKDSWNDIQGAPPSDKCPTCDQKLTKAKAKTVHGDYWHRLENAESAIDLFRKKVSERETAIRKAEQEAKDIKAEERALLLSKISVLDGKISELAEKEQRAQSYQAQVEASKKALAQRQQIEQELEAAKIACDLLETELSEQSQKTMTQLMAIANKIASPAMKTELRVTDRGVGRLSQMPNTPGCHFIHLDTFSGTETLLAQVGIAMALCSQYDLKLLVMDELAFADPRTRRAIYLSINQAIKAGVIHQFIGAALDEDGFDEVQWGNVISVSPLSH